MIPELVTPRLLLRPPRLDDAQRVATLLDNFAVSGNLARVPHPYRLSDARAWLRMRRDDLPPGETNFAIEYGDHGYVGQVGFHLGHRSDTIVGYWLGETYWGRGIMTEALSRALDWYFAQTAAETLESGVFHFNAASLAVQKKLGFTEIGRSRVLCLARGEEVEHIDTQLTRRVWSSSR